MKSYYRKPTRYYANSATVGVFIERGTVFECSRCGLVEEYSKSDFANIKEWHAKYLKLQDRAFTHSLNKCQEVFLSQASPPALPADLEQTSIFDLLGVT